MADQKENAERLTQRLINGNGVWFVQAKHSTKVLTVHNISTEQGAKIVQYDLNDGVNQHWSFSDAGEGYFYITNPNSGKVITQHGGNEDNNGYFDQWENVEQSNQQFRLESSGVNGYYYLVVKHSGKAVSVHNVSTENNADIVQFDLTEGQENQFFSFSEQGTLKLTKDLLNGVWFIQAKHSGKVLTIQNISTEQGAKIVQYEKNNGVNQHFTFTDAGDGHFYITNTNSGKVITQHGGNQDDNGYFDQWENVNQTNQQFRLESTGSDGYYFLVVKHSGKAVSVHNVSTENEAGIVQYTTTQGQENQFFSFTQEESSLTQQLLNGGVWNFESEHSRKVLTVHNLSTEQGAKIVQYEQNGGENQDWNIVDAGDGYFFIVNEHSRQHVTQHGGNQDNNGYIDQWQGVGQDNQSWKLVGAVGSYYFLEVKHSGKVLTVLNGSADNNAELVQYDNHNQTHQHWKVVRIR